MAKCKREEEVASPNAAGWDVSAPSRRVAVPRRGSEKPVREFGEMTDDLDAQADCLIACGVDTAALEFTGMHLLEHLCSLLGLCPDSKISGEEVLSAQIRRSTDRIRQAHQPAAVSLSRSDSALGAIVAACVREWQGHGLAQVSPTSPPARRTPCSRAARTTSIKALQHCAERQRQRSIAALRRSAANLGLATTPAAAAA